MIAYLQDFATKRKLEYKQDSVGNMVIRRPGSGGGESAPTVVIQVRSRYSHSKNLLPCMSPPIHCKQGFFIVKRGEKCQVNANMVRHVSASVMHALDITTHPLFLHQKAAWDITS